MFTGIVEEIGKIAAISNYKNFIQLKVLAKKVLEDVSLGDSIAVNGICLTVTGFSTDYFTADVMPETLKRSSLKYAKSGSSVNLERAMAANGRFGGHIVSGHIDGIGKILSITKDRNAIWYRISTDSEILKYIVEKGSITIDGISLTVAKVTDSDFSISAIPHTVAITILGQKKTGDTVNLENDILGKYVEKIVNYNNKQQKNTINLEFLAENGF